MLPPEPEFNIFDNEDCRDMVNYYFESAYDRVKELADVDSNIQKILDLQQEFGFELTNNKAFFYWTFCNNFLKLTDEPVCQSKT